MRKDKQKHADRIKFLAKCESGMRASEADPVLLAWADENKLVKSWRELHLVLTKAGQRLLAKEPTKE